MSDLDTDKIVAAILAAAAGQANESTHPSAYVNKYISALKHMAEKKGEIDAAIAAAKSIRDVPDDEDQDED